MKIKIKNQKSKQFLIIDICLLTIGIGLFLSGGCSSINSARSQKEEIMSYYSAGNYKKAGELSNEKLQDRLDSGDQLMWMLEDGTAKFAAGDYRGSIDSFDKAEAVVDDFENRASLTMRRIGAEIGAAYTNPNALPYKGYYYEKILINIYKSLDYLALGEFDAALVEIRRARFRQKQAEEEFTDEISREEQKLQEQEIQKEAKQANMAPEQILSIKEIKNDIEEIKSHSNKLYGNYVNPFVTYMSALGYLAESDYDGAVFDFKNLYRIESSNEVIQKDYVTAAEKSGAELPAELNSVKPYQAQLDNNMVYVIFANGLSAARKEKQIELILPYVGYSGIAYPVMEYFPNDISHVNISTSTGENIKTVQICDMDAIVSQCLEEELPRMITRLVISTIAKEAATIAAEEAVRRQGNDLAWIGTIVAMSIYKKVFNRADTRCWQTLPKEYQIAQLPKPQDGILTIGLVSKSGLNTSNAVINLKKDNSNIIVFILSNGYGTLEIKQMEMK